MKNSKLWILLFIIPLILTFVGALIRLGDGDGTFFFIVSLISFFAGTMFWLIPKLKEKKQP